MRTSRTGPLTWSAFNTILQPMKSIRRRNVVPPFFTACVPPTYWQLRSLATPRKLSDLSFEEITKLAADYYHPTPSLAVQCFKFNSQNHCSGKSIADYVAELCRLSQHCKHAITLTDMLRDHLVCSINDHRMQRRLLSEKELSFAKASEPAQAMEVVEQDVQSLHKSNPSDVHAVRPEQRCHNQRSKPHSSQPSSPPTQSSTPCPHCGGQHWGRTCRFQTAICHACGKQGHIRHICRS